jgi:hypothetical protein
MPYSQPCGLAVRRHGQGIYGYDPSHSQRHEKEKIKEIPLITPSMKLSI